MYAVYSTETSDTWSGQLNIFLGLFSTLELAVDHINKIKEYKKTRAPESKFSYAIYKCKLDIPVIINEYNMEYLLEENIKYYSGIDSSESDVESVAEEKFTTLASYLWNNYFR